MVEAQGEYQLAQFHPDIATAWLVLSHGAFLGAAIAATAVSVGLIIVAYANAQINLFPGIRRLRRLAMGWNICSFLISAWTVYAISRTWQAGRRWPSKARIFDNFGYITLMLLAFSIALFNVWTFHTACRWRPGKKRLQRPQIVDDL